ncbi:lipopolysaccharide biosynthesis protein [uncultured Treponema sp.]|uniref:lipopolysaccharide biosynthesis protein n=1 Tax=uncultured Treponema sp. TaxID=162155 RepID=UPI002584EF93|nr:lipopolysaccharide biosynthesis protein [uncultured Treponema sp.]
MEQSNSKRIVKNTIFLYFRMLLIMFVAFYTSRITLKILGVEDYGIYQSVCGVVTFLAFISNALGGGTSRFITFEMGKENPKLRTLFSTVRLAHIVLGILIVIVGEVVGQWFIKYKLIIPQERISAAQFAFHFSMITTFFQITQVPYNAIIIAYERMNVYAYVSIAEAILKLSIVFLLNMLAFDKLQVYAVLICSVTIIVIVIYKVYCRINFQEVRSKLVFDKEMFKSVANFSSWSLLSNSAISFANQGVTIVTNMFFAPSVVTVRSLGLQINNIVNQFIGNFRTAVNPQIVKNYAAGDYNASKKLTLNFTKYTFYLSYLVVLPLYLLVEPALTIWLGQIPNGTIPFVKLALVQSLCQVFDTSLYSAIYAKGQIKENALISPIFGFIQLPIIYVLFKFGFSPIALGWVAVICYGILGIVVKPLIVHFVVKYSLREIYHIIFWCLMVAVLSGVFPIFLAKILNVNMVLGFFIVLFSSFISIGLVVFFIGIDKDMRRVLIRFVKQKFIRK